MDLNQSTVNGMNGFSKVALITGITGQVYLAEDFFYEYRINLTLFMYLFIFLITCTIGWFVFS